MPALPRNNLSYAIRFKLEAGGSGSGFLLNTDDGAYLVTAKHVLFEKGIELYADRATATLIGDDGISKVMLRLNLAALQASGNLRKHEGADVTVIRIGSRNSETMVTSFNDGVDVEGKLPPGVAIIGMRLDGIHLLKDVTVSNDVFVYGYPASLGHKSQLDPDIPLLRRGIVAGMTNDRRIIIDSPVYFGNSGGLVIESVAFGPALHKMAGIGIAVEMVPFIEELMSKQFRAQVGIRYENSGYAIVEPMDRILDLIDPSDIASLAHQQ